MAGLRYTRFTMTTPTADSPAAAPAPPLYVGHQALVTRVLQHVMNPLNRHALALTGQPGIGRTALLQHCARIFDSSVVVVSLSLNSIDFRDEAAWLHQLHEATMAALEGLEVARSRLDWVPAPADASALRDWLRNAFLPEYMRVIRSHRRLAWLFDDADALLQAIERGALPADHLEFLHTLLQAQPQASLVLALDIKYEERPDRLAPLVTPSSIQRIQRLNAGDSAELLRRIVPDLEDAHQGAILRQAGGYPRLLLRYAELARKVPANQRYGEEWLKPIHASVYQESSAEMRRLWQTLNRDERLVLTALASLLYEDPLRVPGVPEIDRWLVETDYPLDETAVGAALRALEYREMLRMQVGGVAFTVGMLQKWLLENARLDAEALHASDRLGTISWGRWLLLGVALLLLLGLALLLLLPSPALDLTPALPTVTLGP